MALHIRPLVLVFSLFFVSAGPALALDAITLKNGDVIHGEVVERGRGQVVIEHPQLGRLTLDVDETEISDRDKDMTETVADSGGVAPGEAQQGRSRASRGLFGTKILRGWKNTFGAGLTGSEGGFEDTKLSISFKTEIEDRKRRWDFDAVYFLNLSPQDEESKDQTITKDQGFVQLRRKWFFPDSERWKRSFVVARTRYDYDQFQQWKHRIAASTGPGYFLLRNDRWELPINVGLGFSSIFGDLDDTAPEATLGFDVSWRVTNWASLNTSNQIFLDLQDTDQFRTVQDLRINIEPKEFAGVGFGFGILYRFDSQSDGRENDVTYVSSLTYGF
jgi:hypothetical protein